MTWPEHEWHIEPKPDASRLFIRVAAFGFEG